MAGETPETENPNPEDTVSENDPLAEAKAAAADAEQALEVIEAEAAHELPADDVEAAVPVPEAATKAAAKKAPPEPEETGRVDRRKVREGIVVSDAMASTIVVAVVDRVRVTETRPLSKLKRWRLTDVVERAR